MFTIIKNLKIIYASYLFSKFLYNKIIITVRFLFLNNNTYKTCFHFEISILISF